METPGLIFLTDWTPSYMVYYATDSLNTGNILAVPTQGEHKPFPVVATPYGEYNGVVSSNGHWMAYVSDESGVFECYVVSFPDASRKWQISTGGGTEPRWDPKGRGLYYYGATGTVHFVEAQWDETSFAVGATTALFESPNRAAYQVAADGDRFLVLEDADDGSVQPLTVIMGWDERLKQQD
jgi:hypothetical protein